MNKQLEDKAYQLSHTSLFKNIGCANIKHSLPYFFNSNYYKYNEIIYEQEKPANYAYFILEGEVELVKE